MLPVGPFLEFCQQNALFAPGQRILAAVSGGRDSVLLAHLLNAAKIGFGIAHVNFQLRGEESLRDEHFVRGLAELFSVPFFVYRADTKSFAQENRISTQMAARDLRYAWFEQIRAGNGFDHIAVGHHRTDAAETVLLNLVRGTGIAGLHGIRAKNGHIIRPLLFLNRQAIDELFSPGKIAYVEDSSNASNAYARNRIRHDVLPVLKALNPALEQTFLHNAQRFSEAEDVLDAHVAALRKKFFRSENGLIYVDKPAFLTLKPQQLLAAELLRPYGFSESVTTQIISGLNGQPGRQYFSARHRLTIGRDTLIISPFHTNEIPPVSVLETSASVRYAGFTLKKCITEPSENDRNVIRLDTSALRYPLSIRAWQPGDRILPTGMRGSKKLSDLFTDLKLAGPEKAAVPVLVNGDGRIIWVCGLRADRRFVAGSATEKVVIFELSENSL